MKNKRMIGFLLVVSGCFFWGIGGTMSQLLFSQGIEVSWLVSTRLVIAGILLLITQAIFKDRRQILDIWRQKYTAFRLIIFAIVGMLAVQYTYMASIKEGNAAVATLLQYLAPVMIIVWVTLRGHSVFTRKDAVTIVLALSGSFLLLTNGSLSAFAVPLPAIIWGLLSGLSLAFYTLYAIPLLQRFDSLVVVGWGMLLAGVTMSFVQPPWDVDISNWTGSTVFYLIIVIIFGTMLAFWFYIESLQTLTAKETSLLGNIEPLTAVLATVLWLKEPFGSFQWFGTSLILAMMIYIALRADQTRDTISE
ncbi:MULTISPECIES: EamA family transporter [Solibacillus]|uniref:EamA family transporter n=1 Tax=Solibacillus merdavium TaxID=2762218 RepID=A0ABR8XM68_9BACL|nr:EamA family transporter [Solibacillus merdavium]MBD8033009.1 EamA family transporter [Solibacillus merdavium]